MVYYPITGKVEVSVFFPGSVMIQGMPFNWIELLVYCIVHYCDAFLAQNERNKWPMGVL